MSVLRSGVGRLWPLLLCAALCTSCEPRTVEIKGLDELTSEIRSQRLQNSQRAAAGSNSGNQDVRGDQSQQSSSQQASIHQAMAPLRDVLSQLGTSQRELSARQATLTQEMRRWTQLLVGSMQSERNDEAKQLAERLAELEQTIAAQDVRHRQVEELLGTALDRTADQLGEFLKRLGANANVGVGVGVGVGTTGTGAGNPGDTGTTANGEATASEATANRSAAVAGKPDEAVLPGTTPTQPKYSTQPKVDGSEPTPANGDPGSVPATRPGGDELSQASMAWLWGLAVASLVSGCVLLFGRRRSQPVAMAPEMQFAPPADFSSELYADLGQQQLAREPQFASGPTADVETRDEPEVEKLWAAAALLGEAIGRLKHTGEAMPPELGGAQALPEAPEDQHAAALLGEELLGEELQPNVARQPSTEQVAIEVDCDLADLLVIDDDEQIDPVVFADPAAAPWPDSLLDLTGANGIEFDAVQALGLPDPERPRSVPTTHQTTPVVTPLVDTVAPQRAPGSIADVSHPKGYVSTASTPQPAARHASSSPITCRLHFPANQKAEGLLRGLLGRDPRVLVTPAPEVRNMMGELEVSFALLPGLPAGERSLLEQQLRDTVA